MEIQTPETWPILNGSDELLLNEIFKRLTTLTSGNAYSWDGEFARGLELLPRGLRAMAATHWLDISLTMDSITWHFGNFGEPRLVAMTEEGLLELGLDDLSNAFRDAKNLVQPLLAKLQNSEKTLEELIDQNHLREQADEIDGRAWDCDSGEGSVIHAAWVRYARAHPAEVFAVS